MREETKKRVVEEIITTYYSDDGKFSSIIKEEVEAYEACQKLEIIPVRTFTLPDDSRYYKIIKITSKDSFLAWKGSCGRTRIVCVGFKEEDLPAKVDGYFITHFEDEGDCMPYYCIEPVKSFLRDLRDDIDYDQANLDMKRSTAMDLEELK